MTYQNNYIQSEYDFLTQKKKKFEECLSVSISQLTLGVSFA